MLSRSLRSLAVVLIIQILGVASLSEFANANETPNEKFQKDLASLLGASVQTKHGKMSMRQRTDSLGRVRKQIIVGPDFSEIQLDQDGDGTVDFWEVSQGKKTVVASDPNRGRFLRLVVSDKSSRGIHESTYLLDLNSRSYNLLKRTFMGKAVSFNIDATDGFEAVDGPSTLSADIVPKPSAIGAASAGVDTRIELQEASLADAKLIEHQAAVLGTELQCESPDSVNNRLAALQRDWWNILKKDANDQADRLAEIIGASSMFADSCKTPARAKDFQAMTKSIANVMMSSSKGEPMSSEKTRGRYLRCLEKMGLGATAARMEKVFLSGLKDPFRTENLVKCDWKPGQAGRSVPAQTSPFLQQVTVHMCLADDGKGKTTDGSTANYANVMFHELMHVAGVVDEKLVHAAQACCGDPTDSRDTACTKLDNLVSESIRYHQIETHMSRVSAEMLPFVSQLELDFGADTANDLYRAYIMGLDKYRNGTDFKDGLVSDAAYANCKSENSEEFCREKWRKAIRDYTDSFFPKECRKIAPGATRKQCKAFSKTLTDSVASAIEKSLIDSPQNYASNPPSAVNDPTGSSSGSNPGVCPAPAVVRKSIFLKGASLTPPLLLRAYRQVSRVVFGVDVQADEKDCADQIGVNPDGGMQPRVVVPGAQPVGEVTGTSGRTSSSGGRSAPRVIRENSSLPVTRVDSPSSSRSFAESRYRRATDFVGNSTRGLDALRSAVLPSAIAAEGSGGTRNRLRLGPKDSFIAFNPDKNEKVTAKIENPFAVSRSIASIDMPALTAHLAGTPGGASAVGTSAVLSGGGASASSDVPSGVSKSREKRTAAEVGKQSSAATGRTSAAPAAAFGAKNVSGLSKPQQNLLANLFTLPYRQIASRLKQLEVIEALIAARISVQDDQGRLLGSTRAVTKYAYVGSDRPLLLKTEKK